MLKFVIDGRGSSSAAVLKRFKSKDFFFNKKAGF